jgi:hypothetical protein
MPRYLVTLTAILEADSQAELDQQLKEIRSETIYVNEELFEVDIVGVAPLPDIIYKEG